MPNEDEYGHVNFYGNQGAGLLILCSEDNTVLLLKRSSLVNEPGTWGLPGGKIEEGEDAYSAAIRESLEELGGLPTIESTKDKLSFKEGEFTYTTFVVTISLASKKSWQPTLNWENSEYRWFPVTAMPANLHFGVKYIKNLLMEKGNIPPLKHEYDWVVLKLKELQIPEEIVSKIDQDLLSKERDSQLKDLLKPAIKYLISKKSIDGIKAINLLLKTEEKWRDLELDLPKHEQSAYVQYLYHGTNAVDALSILKSKTFSKSSAFDRVSFTSDLAAASKFGDVVLVFDGKKLQRKGARKMQYISPKQQSSLLKSNEDYEIHGEDGKHPKISDIYKYEREWFTRLPFSFSDDDLVKIIILKRFSPIENRERIKLYFEELTTKPVEIVQSGSYFPSSKESSPEDISLPLVDLRDSLISGVAHHAYGFISEVRKKLSTLDKGSSEYYDFKRDILDDANYIFRYISDYDHLFKPNYTFNVKLDANLIRKFAENIESSVKSITEQANKNSEYSKIADHANGLLTNLRKSLDLSIKSVESDDFYRSLLKDYSSTYHFVFKDKLVKWIENHLNELISLVREKDLRYSTSYGNSYASVQDFLVKISNVQSVPVDIWRRFPLSLLDNDNFYLYPVNDAVSVFKNNTESGLLSSSEIRDFIIKNRVPYTDDKNAKAMLQLLAQLGYSTEEQE